MNFYTCTAEIIQKQTNLKHEKYDFLKTSGQRVATFAWQTHENLQMLRVLLKNHGQKFVVLHPH